MAFCAPWVAPTRAMLAVGGAAAVAAAPGTGLQRHCSSLGMFAITPAACMPQPAQLRLWQLAHCTSRHMVE